MQRQEIVCNCPVTLLALHCRLSNSMLRDNFYEDDTAHCQLYLSQTAAAAVAATQQQVLPFPVNVIWHMYQIAYRHLRSLGLPVALNQQSVLL